MAAVGRCPVLVERDEELRALSAVAGETAAAGARLVVLTGEGGSGKSRLAQELAASLPEIWSRQTVRITRTATEIPSQDDGRPLLIVLEDAHFLDPAALDRLPAMLDELAREPVLLILTFRLAFQPPGSAEMRSLARLVRDPRAREMRLMALSPEGIAEMAAAMGRYVPGDLYGRTGGNPFWAEELLREQGRLSWTVVEAVGAQLDEMQDGARELARALAVAGEPLPADAAGELIDDLDAAWSALAGAGLVERNGDALALRHALVGEAIESRMGPEELAGWHGRLASVLTDRHVQADRLARHWAAAGDVHTAAEIARLAAPALRAAGATRRAYDSFELALANPPDDALAAAELHEDAALTAARIGEYESMRAWIEAADRLYRDAGQPDRAVRMVLDPSLDYLPVNRSERIRDEPVEGLLLDAREQLQRGDPERTGALLDAAIQAARERQDGMALARTARVLALTLGEFQRADTLLEEAGAFADVAAQPGRRSRILTIRAGLRTAQGDMHSALELFRRAVAISRREPEAVYRVGEIALGSALMRAGRMTEGAALLEAGGSAVPWSQSISATANGVRRFEQGDPAGLDAIETGVDALLTEMDLDPLGLAVVGGHLLGLRAVAEAHAGRWADCLRTVDRLDALAPEPFSEVAADIAYALARTGAACQDGAVLGRARRKATELARMASGPAVLGAVEAVRGFTAVWGERTDEAVRRLQAAADQFERAPRAALAAELLCDAAEAAGPGTIATNALSRAQRICVELGLGRTAARAVEVRAALAQLPPRLPGALAELTSREREVVLLAAEGLSNREIGARLYLSEGTVRNYLSTAFTKLGVSRRAELGRLVAVAELVPRR